MRLARVDDASDEAIEQEGDLGTEAPCDSFRGQLERIAQPQDAQIVQAREGLLGPIEQEKRQVVETLAQLGQGKAAPHLQPARFRAREKPRRERRGCDTHRGAKAEVVDAAPNGGDQLRVPLEEPESRFDLEHDALPIDAGHRRKLPGPCGEPFERRALDFGIALDRAQVRRERTRSGHALPFANAGVPRRLVGARDDLALGGAFRDYEWLTGDSCALDDLERECGKLEGGPEHGAVLACCFHGRLPRASAMGVTRGGPRRLGMRSFKTPSSRERTTRRCAGVDKRSAAVERKSIAIACPASAAICRRRSHA